MHPALRRRFLHGNKYYFICCGTNLPTLGRRQRSPVSALRLVERLVIITTAVVDVGRCRRMPLIYRPCRRRHMMCRCLPLSHESRKCEGEFEGPQVVEVRGGALMSAVSRDWGVQCALFIARILQTKISNFARPSHASFNPFLLWYDIGTTYGITGPYLLE